MKTTHMIARVTFLIQLALGLLIWVGVAKSALRPIHMVNGFIFIAALLALAILAARAKAPMGLVVVTIIWALIVVVFGMTQRDMLKGGAHWVIQVAHLLVGIVAAALGDRLVAKVPARTDRAAVRP